MWDTALTCWGGHRYAFNPWGSPSGHVALALGRMNTGCRSQMAFLGALAACPLRSGLPWLPHRPPPGSETGSWLRADPKERETPRPHRVHLIRPGVRQGDAQWGKGSAGCAWALRVCRLGGVPLQGRAAVKMLFPPCRLNSKSRAMPWKQDKKWSWWMTCLQLEVREAGAGG